MRRSRKHTATTVWCAFVIVVIGSAHSGAAQGHDPDEADALVHILVRFAPGSSGVTQHRALGIASARTVAQYHLVPGLASVRVDLDAELACALIERMPGVLYAEPDYLVELTDTDEPTTDDPYFPRQWGLNNTGQAVLGLLGMPGADMRGASVWGRTDGGRDVVVAVIDTGIDWTHPDLDDNIWTNPNEIPGNGIDDDANGFVDDVRGWDFVGRDANPRSSNGHGTHVAGIIAAERDNGIGIAGVAWRAKIMPVRVIGSGRVRVSTVIAGLQYAADNGARVVNMSLFLASRSQAMHDALNELDRLGIVVVVSAGNNGRNLDRSPLYPASYQVDNVIAVAALTSRDRFAGFSNYGPSSVHVAAPGTRVLSTWPNRSYRYLDGTSMAAPHVAGVAALLIAEHPGWTPTQVRNRIVNTARRIDRFDRFVIGGGVLDTVASVLRPTRPRRPGRPRLLHLGDGRILIIWRDNSDNETTFEVQRQRFVDGRWQRRRKIATLDADTTELVHRRALDRWRFRVRAVNAVGGSRWSRWRPINTAR